MIDKLLTSCLVAWQQPKRHLEHLCLCRLFKIKALQKRALPIVPGSRKLNETAQRQSK